MSTLPLLFPDETLEPMTRLARAKNLWQKAAAATALRPRHFKPIAALERGLTDPTCDMIMGRTAEVLAHEFGVSRGEQDEFALRSHQRASAAISSGKLAHEIVPEYAGSRFEPATSDNGPRIRRWRPLRSSSRFSTGATGQSPSATRAKSPDGGGCHAAGRSDVRQGRGPRHFGLWRIRVRRARPGPYGFGPDLADRPTAATGRASL